jgi:hypothetical protein
MQFRAARFSVRQIGVLLALLFVLGLSLAAANAQKRKHRPVRRHAVAATPSPSPGADAANGDPQIISTADQTSAAAKSVPRRSPTPAPETENDMLRRTITDLSGQVNKLGDKLNQMEDQQRSLIEIERLNRAEQRAETFRAQLRDVQAKLTDLQGQMDQVDDALLPENIERAVGLYGTTHPEVARDNRRRQLEGQKARLKSQYDQLEQSRVRLEAAVASADTEVEKLRAQMDASNQQPADPTTTTPPPTPTPVETPSP